MAQHDFSIANQTFPATRTDLNNALEALATLSSGATEPTTTYADMLWYDSGNNILKMRSEADDAWINVGYLCQSTNKFCILDDTNVVNTSGTQTGLLGDQATSAWEAGTSTTESLVSPAKVKAAVDAHGGTTLLASSATTGSSTTISGLDLSNYSFIIISAVNLSHSATTGGPFSLLVESQAFSASVASTAILYGQVVVDLSSGIGSGGFGETTSLLYHRDTNLSKSSTSVTMSWTNTPNFDNGSFAIYGA